MQPEQHHQKIRSYFENTLKTYGASAKGVDWNSEEARALRFDQLAKILPTKKTFTLLDYGSGYGAFADYLLARGFGLTHYIGYDIAAGMVEEGKQQHPNDDRIVFTNHYNEVPLVEYSVSCGVFNMKQETPHDQWTEFVISCLHQIDQKTTLGFSVNFLTKYSDPDRMRPDLYYADPCLFFDYCKTRFAKNVALLHDYDLYDFTLLVRKNG